MAELAALDKCTTFPTEKHIVKKIERAHVQGSQDQLCFLAAPWDANHVEFTAVDYRLPKYLRAFFNILEAHKTENNAGLYRGVLITDKYYHELCAVRLPKNDTRTERWIQFDLNAFRHALPPSGFVAKLTDICSVM